MAGVVQFPVTPAYANQDQAIGSPLSATTVNVAGSYTQFIASTVRASNWLIAEGSVNFPDDLYRIEIATGPASSETVKLTFSNVGKLQDAHNVFSHPFQIVAGTRVAIRITNLSDGSQLTWSGNLVLIG